jgi:hypothetical protein
MAQARINKKLKDKFRNEDVLRPVPRSPIARQNVTCHARINNLSDLSRKKNCLPIN